MGDKKIAFVASTYNGSQEYITTAQQAGYATSCYLNSLYCLANIQKTPPDIICVDLDVCPGWGSGLKDEGLEAAVAVRNDMYKEENPSYGKHIVGIYLIQRLREMFPETPIIAAGDMPIDQISDINHPNFIMYDLLNRNIKTQFRSLCDEYVEMPKTEPNDFLKILKSKLESTLERIA